MALRVPVIDIHTVGAGGGSIARVDALKRVTVGPESASALLVGSPEFILPVEIEVAYLY